MPKPRIALIIIILICGLYAWWQSLSESILRDLPMVQALSVNADGILTISGWLAQDCLATPRADMKRFPNNLDIQLVRERSSLSACGLQVVSFEVELGLESENVPLFIIINGEVWALTVAQRGEINFEAQSLFPVTIEGASIAPIAAANGEYQLSLRGSQAIGCELPEIYTLRETEDGVMIGAFNAIPADTACPDMLVEFDESFVLPATNVGEDALFAVNSFLIDKLETTNVSEKDKVLTNIFRVGVKITETQPRQVRLDVEGEHPDGCEFPVIVAQSRVGNTIQVEVYREVPADVFCPMILRPYQGTITLDGDFESGAYTINVNAHSQSVEI